MRRQVRPSAPPSTFYHPTNAPLSNIPQQMMSGVNTQQSMHTIHSQSQNVAAISSASTSNLQHHDQRYIQPPTSTFSSIPPNLSNMIQKEGKQLEMNQDKAMLELLNQLEDFSPIIPDELTEHYMIKAGLDIKDVKIKRLIALLTQKYVTDIAQNALQYSKLRQGGSSGSTISKSPNNNNSKRLILTMEDLSSAMRDYDIHVKRPPYYR